MNFPLNAGNTNPERFLALSAPPRGMTMETFRFLTEVGLSSASVDLVPIFRTGAWAREFPVDRISAFDIIAWPTLSDSI